MNIKNTMLKVTTVVAVVFSFIACEDDFETIGAGVIGGPGFNAELYDEAEISAETYNLPPVQTNNLPNYLLGVYNHPVFGTQRAGVLSQVSLSTLNPSFGNQPVVDSVVLSVPYFSREVESETDQKKYVLDSIYGNEPFKLSVVETNFFLNPYDPESDFQQAQKYYSNLEPKIEENLTGNVLYENPGFKPSAEEIVEYPYNSEGERDTVKLAPALRLHLSPGFFQSKIIDKEGSPVLESASSFKNYFRSIYLKTEKTGEEGNMMLLDLAQPEAGITIYYRVKVADAADVDEDGDKEELIDAYRSYRLGLGGTKVNTFEQEAPQFDDANRLFLKGGEGSMAIINLFSGEDADGDGVSDELDMLRENNWLINEANLEFFVDRSYVNAAREPERLFIYDLKNNIRLADYRLDAPGKTNALNSISNNNHLVPLKRNENGEGISYKIRLTQHVNNILNKDSTNLRLGVVVSQNVNLLSYSAVLQPDNDGVKRVPVSSVITPEATVLYGPHAQDDAKRLKLKIYYTEPKN